MKKIKTEMLRRNGPLKQKRIMKKLKPKNGDAQKKRSGREVRGVSPEAGRELMMG